MLRSHPSLLRLALVSSIPILLACTGGAEPTREEAKARVEAEAEGKDTAVDTPKTDVPAEEPFAPQTEQFADVRILRYRVPGFEALPLQQKQLVYYLYQAALSGRDIIWDQNYRHNLTVRRTLEALFTHSGGTYRSSPEWGQLVVYAKRVWFSNGIHHHYSTKKLVPEFSPEYFAAAVAEVPASSLPLAEGETPADLVARLKPVLFDPNVDAKKVNLDPDKDLVTSSATNFYGPGVTQKAVEAFYAARTKKDDPTPISWGLNSRLVVGPKGLEEQVWKVDGLYGPAIAEIVRWLEKAITVAENDAQKAALEKLVEYYQTGDLATFDAYSIAWVADVDSRVDVVNGFIEVYGDPLGRRGAYESVVSIRDLEASKRIDAIAKEAQWFEDHSPIPDAYKKPEVQGISAKVITVVVESGDAAPSTPIGINLPNANWIRTKHGSKSVNLGNIVHSYDIAKKTSGAIEEFAATPEEIERGRKWSDLAGTLHTDMHEVIGHASGRLKEGVTLGALKNYASTLEEARADLVALYYLADPKLVEIGVMPDLEVGKAAYDAAIRGGLVVQLSRLELGEQLEEAHMRNRQLIAAWVFEQGQPEGVIERLERDGKTYFVVRDYDKLRGLFARLLHEIQRIESEGDYEAGRKLVEDYGVKVEPKLHAEVKQRYDALGIAPYAGFIQPRLVPVLDGDAITDVRIEYPDDFTAQMLEYARTYSFLPTSYN